MEILIPVALDESIQRLSFDEIRSISGVDFLILKPTLLGGIERTLEITKQAKSRALDTAISSSFESPLGISILAELAGAASHGHMAAGLDTLKWFKEDSFAQAIEIKNGAIEVNQTACSSSDINFKLLKKLS